MELTKKEAGFHKNMNLIKLYFKQIVTWLIKDKRN
jgi:hypothetical protein